MYIYWNFTRWAVLKYNNKVKNLLNLSTRKTVDKGRPDYYITPTHDFTQYTKDCEEKYWSKETAFDWDQNVQRNLEEHLEDLNPD